MRVRRNLIGVAALAMVLVASACGSDSGSSADTTAAAGPGTTAAAGPGTTAAGGSSDAGKGISACEVTDTGGPDDKGFNQSAYKGVTDAATQYGITPELLESKTDADYVPNIQSFVDKKCNLIVTVGFLLGDATKAAAEANPDQQFAIVDFGYDPPIANVRTLNFATNESSFLAGYLAAGMTKTGKVGTYGGINIPTVTIFMDGFKKGVEYYNQQKGKTVELLGWDGKDGLFTGNFDKVDDGKTFAKNLADEGADIVLPVAGPLGLGSAAFAQENGKVAIIGVDTDQYVSAPEYKEVYLASILKNIDASVLDSIKNVVETGKPGDAYSGTLANGGTGLSDYHDWASKVPADLQTEIKQLQQDIIDGKVPVS